MARRAHLTVWITMLTLARVLALANGARADEVHTSKNLAAELFDRGVQQLRQGRCDHAPVGDRFACEAARDAFKRAYELYPEGLGALRNLAYVEVGLGLVASAARSFRELALRAPQDSNPARRLWADFARAEAEALSARVPRLAIELAGAPPAQLTIELDGASLAEAAWRTPLELDPGPHELRAEAPDHTPYAQRFELTEGELKRVSIALPEQPAPAPALSAAVPAAAPALAVHAPEQRRATPTARPVRRQLGPLLTMASGTAALAVGLGFGYRAMRQRDRACGDTQSCEPEALATGKRAAHVSTTLTGLGATTAAAGLVWYFVQRKRERRAVARLTPAVTSGGAVLQAVGSF